MDGFKFKVTDYVEIVPIAMRGTIVNRIADNVGNFYYLRREDGVMGGGTDGEWIAYEDELRLVLSTPIGQIEVIECESLKSSHVAGIDSEQIDWDAHKEFMRGL